MCPDVSRHGVCIESKFLKSEEPLWKDNGAGVLDSKGKFANLSFLSLII